MIKYANWGILVIVIFVNSSCKKVFRCEGQGQMYYSFDLPVSIQPQKDTFAVGDTIWIENSFSTQLYNDGNGKTYDVSKVDFQTTLAITDLNTPFPAFSYPNPKIYNVYGSTEGNATSANYQALYIEYTLAEGQFKYKAAFALDRPGFYITCFSSFRNGFDVDITECPNETLGVNYVPNNKGDNNYEMIKNAKDENFAKTTLENFNKIGGYCFYVK